jgi:hypothetical protein
MPFEDELAAPALLDPLDIGPAQARIELAGGPDAERAHVLDALDVADDVAEDPPLGAEHAQAPARLGQQVEHVGEGRLGRRRQAVLDVLVALAEDLQVERQDQGAAVRRLGAVDQPADEVAVAHHVELEPERRLGVGGHVLDRADAHGRERERHAEGLGGPAARISPSACCMPSMPIGARATGMATSMPIILVFSERFSMSTATRWRSLIF